jgi:Lon protease-like protein
MKPKSPFIQPYENLPAELPIYPLENALLPGGELPLMLSEQRHLAMFTDALRSDQLIGMLQPGADHPTTGVYKTGCAGRIRQYRERKDGNLNVMLTGVCRYRVVEELPTKSGYRRAIVDWSDFRHDYEDEEVSARKIDLFKVILRNYFDRNKMQVDWVTLDRLPIEQVVNNLVLILDLSIGKKQRLLEAPTVADRVDLFSELLENKPVPLFGAKETKHRASQ